MFNLETLDTLIAIVVVLFTLSLVVQAIQSALKKLFKLKSRQLEESLIDLFENVLDPKKEPDPEKASDPSNKPAAGRSRLPTLQILPFTKHPSELASKEVREVFKAVMQKFCEIGRVASSGKGMLASISKEDLMKVLRKVGPNTLRPTFIDELEAACREFTKLGAAIEAIKTEHLSGAASANFAKMQEALAPLLNDLQCFFKTDAAGQKSFNKELLLADILNLREIKSGDVLDLLGEVQKSVKEDLAAHPNNTDLEQLDKTLNSIAALFTKFRKQVDEVMAPLRVKLNEVENWYDTVMQSFEERYNRGMKTYAFVIGLFVAVWLNVNIFNVYREVSTDADKRASIVGAGQSAMQRYKEQLAAPEVINKADAENKLKKLVEEEERKIAAASAEYAKFGLRDWGSEKKVLNSEKPDWGSKSAHVLRMLLGWLITAALLSIGAPFWHDALGALFGVKNLLQKRSGTQNVETAAGAGQLKP